MPTIMEEGHPAASVAPDDPPASLAVAPIDPDEPLTRRARHDDHAGIAPTSEPDAEMPAPPSERAPSSYGPPSRPSTPSQPRAMPYPAPYIPSGSNYVSQVLLFLNKQLSFHHVLEEDGYLSLAEAIAAKERHGPEVFWPSDHSKWVSAPTLHEPSRTAPRALCNSETFSKESSA